MDAIVGAGGWCAPSKTIYELGAAHSREKALWRGLIEPTQEERQAAADALYEQEVQDNRNWFATGVFLERVKAHEFDAMQQSILDYHAATESGICNVCVTAWETSVAWPCHTARIVLKFASIDIPEELVYDKPEPVLQDNDNPRWPFPPGPVEVGFSMPEIRVSRGGIKFDMGGRP